MEGGSCYKDGGFPGEDREYQRSGRPIGSFARSLKAIIGAVIMVDVLIISADRERVGSAVREVFQHFDPDLENKTVLIKPNMVKAVPGDAGINTHPEIVRQVVLECKERGAARIVVGDNPGGMTRGSTRIGLVSGIADAAQGHFESIGDEVIECPVQSRFTPHILVSKKIVDADFVINVPIFKTHIFTLISGAFKNVYGYIVGGYKSQLHFLAQSRREFAEILVTVNKIKPPNLHIMDCLTVMDGEGPSKGRVRPYGKIVASTDGIAVDATMCRMVGIDPAQLPFLVLGAEAGLGQFREEMITVKGEKTFIQDFLLPSTFATEEQCHDGVCIASEESIKARADVRPQVNKELCVECGFCAEFCPAQCIRLDPNPLIARDKCIACYCCVELCPKEAFEVEHITLYAS